MPSSLTKDWSLGAESLEADERYSPNWLIQLAIDVMGGIDLDSGVFLKVDLSVKMANRMADGSLAFTTRYDRIYLPVLVFVFIYPFGIPLLFFGLLFKYRRLLYSAEHPDVQARLGFLYRVRGLNFTSLSAYFDW